MESTRRVLLPILLLPWLIAPALIAQEQPAAAIEAHYRLLESGQFELAREHIHTQDLRPEEVESLPKVMKNLQADLLKGGGFDRLEITRKTRCTSECLLLGKVLLKDGSSQPVAWKLAQVDGSWRLIYSRQIIQQHGS